MLRHDCAAVNELCLNCERAECPGICDKLKEDMGEIDNSKRIQTITWRGMTRPVAEWAEILGIPRATLYRKLNGCTDINAIFENLHSNDSKTFPNGAIEETYLRLSTMHIDYYLYWEQKLNRDGSAGMVARYGAVRVSPTNATSNPTVMRAMPELMLTEEALNRRAWVACVLFIIERYRTQKQNRIPDNPTRAKILEWRAIDGLTLSRICENLNAEAEDERQVTVKQLRKYMSSIVNDITKEAMRRGLIDRPQK